MEKKMIKIKSSCIIDDDQIFIYGTKRMMKNACSCENIYVFDNGLDAITALNKMVADGEALPEVIFLDLNMPIMDGWEFLDNFIKIPDLAREKIALYVISSSIDPVDIQRVKTYNVVSDYILKPVTPKDLHNVLSEMV